MEECINEYKFERRIRFNDNNRLFLCTKKETKEKYIIKRLENNKTFEKFINNNISIQKSLHHRNVSKLLDYKIGERYTYLIFEYNKYSLNLDNYLQRYIRKYGKPLPQKIVQYIMTKIISAFMYLHEKNIMHRNLKPENILIIFSIHKKQKKN
jgi:aurora kinase